MTKIARDIQAGVARDLDRIHALLGDDAALHSTKLERYHATVKRLQREAYHNGKKKKSGKKPRSR